MERIVIKSAENNSDWLDIAGCIYNVQSYDMVIELYHQYGTKCVEKLNGDFAFVLYDSCKQLLFGAVDRLGSKTLYYHVGDHAIEYDTAFLPLCKGKEYTINPYVRQCYFSMQYIPSPYTIVNEVNKLNPGECFTYSQLTGELKIWQYWDLYSNSCRFDKPTSFEEAVQMSETLITDAVKLRMKHKPSELVGTFLSGGIDSSLVNMFAANENKAITAYSVSFSENEWDESSYAKSVAQHLGIGFVNIRCSAEEAIKVIDNLQRFYDEPMGDASMIPTSLLCEKAGEHIDIALGGDGGDEMFFGYPRYLRYANRRWIYNFPYWLRNPAALFMDRIGNKRAAQSLRLRDVESLYMNRRLSNKAERFNATAIQQTLEQCRYIYGDGDIRRRFNDFDIKTLMCHAYNVKLDRAAFRAGLSARSPLLDYRIAEYTRLLPISYCFSEDMGQKRILRELLYKRFPRELFERKKRGFGVPIGSWLRNELRDYLLDMLNEQTIQYLPDFDGEKLLQIRDRHIAGVENQTTLLWLCINYVAWYNLFIQTIKDK